jgi:predicted RNA polymerase sigma factor
VPDDEELADRLRGGLRVVYLIFNEATRRPRVIAWFA